MPSVSRRRGPGIPASVCSYASGWYLTRVASTIVTHQTASPITANACGWSLALTLLAVDAGAYRIFSLTDYLNDPHLIQVSLAELLILMIAVALVAPDAVHAPTATPAPPPHPQPG